MTPLRVLVAIPSSIELDLISEALEAHGHCVVPCNQGPQAVRELYRQISMLDLVIADETFGRLDPDGGIELAEICQTQRERRGAGYPEVIVIMRSLDRFRFLRAQRSGAHCVARGKNFDALIGYVQTIADQLSTAELLGPILFARHSYSGLEPDADCAHCRWLGASLRYGLKECEVGHLPPRPAATLIALMQRHRSQSDIQIAEFINTRAICQQLLRFKTFRSSAVRMEVSRTRGCFDAPLSEIGSTCKGKDLIPFSDKNEGYRLICNWKVIHVSVPGYEKAMRTHG